MEIPIEEEVLKKGSWTPEEDELLLYYVKKYGDRDWNSVRSRVALRRTGRSCRDRWNNELKPCGKRGKLSEEEAKVVIKKQKLYGNKWTKIAKALEGRTPNDLKNFWNTKVVKKTERPPPPPLPKSQYNTGESIAINEAVPTFNAYMEGKSSSKDQSFPPAYEPEIPNPEPDSEFLRYFYCFDGRPNQGTCEPVNSETQYSFHDNSPTDGFALGELWSFD